MELIELLGIIVLSFPQFREDFEDFRRMTIWLLIGTFVFGLLLAGWSMYSEQEKKKLSLEERLRPSLEICSGTRHEEGRFRIRVKNLSDVTVRYSARLEKINPAIKYRTPAHLEITGVPYPRREGDIPAKKEGLVDVFVEESLFHQTPFGLLSAEDPPAAIPIPQTNYEIVICVYSTIPQGAEVSRRFYLVNQSGGTLALTDGGLI